MVDDWENAWKVHIDNDLKQSELWADLVVEYMADHQIELATSALRQGTLARVSAHFRHEKLTGRRLDVEEWKRSRPQVWVGSTTGEDPGTP